jgi:heme oxygenase
MNLREATSELHKKAEQMEFNQRMFKGELSAKDYLRYLLVQSTIFQCIEEHGHSKLHKDLPRLKRVFEDIQELQKDVVYDSSTAELQSVKKYGMYLESLNDERLYPHIYLNYLALAYGGQMMKSKIPGSGKMYDFDNLNEVISSIRAIQKDEWAMEVNKGFAHIITILDDLQRTS